MHVLFEVSVKKFLIIISFLSITPFLKAQNNIDLNSLPDVEDIIIQLSNFNADTIIIGLHGGPTSAIATGDFAFFFQFPSFSVVELKQYQHLHPEILQDTETTLNQAIAYNDTTVAMLQKTILHFTNQDKTVSLIGHSFGAFLVTEYIDDYGMDYVDRVVPMAGRMNMNDESWMALEEGYNAYFSNDGLSPIIPTVLAGQYLWGTMKLQAGIAYNRWVDSLSAENLAKFMFVYSEYDQRVGRLIPDEIDMIESANGSVLKVPQGSHFGMFTDTYMNQVLDFLRADALGVNIITPAIHDVKIYPTIISNLLMTQAPVAGHLILRDGVGKLIQEYECQKGFNQFELPLLKPGFYLASFADKNGIFLSSQKLIAQ